MANDEFDPKNIEEYISRLKQNQSSWKLGLGIGAVVLVLLVLNSMVYTIQPEQVGVIQRFGKYIKTTSPGIHYKLPWGIDKVTKVRTTFVFKEEFGFQTRQAGIRTEYANTRMEDMSLMLTGDLNIADVEWSVQFRISDPRKFLFNVRDPIGTVRDTSESAMRMVVGDRSVDEVLTTGRTEINIEMQRVLQQLMEEYETGIKVVTIELQNVYPPEAVKDSFDDVNKAKHEKETVINQAREAYNKVIPQARGEAEKVITSAEGYATKRINEAKGDAKRFLDVYRAYARSPNVIRRRLYIETMADVLQRLDNVWVVDDKLKNMVPILQLMETPKGPPTK